MLASMAVSELPVGPIGAIALTEATSCGANTSAQPSDHATTAPLMSPTARKRRWRVTHNKPPTEPSNTISETGTV
jgi:hypothetical protein